MNHLKHKEDNSVLDNFLFLGYVPKSAKVTHGDKIMVKSTQKETLNQLNDCILFMTNFHQTYQKFKNLSNDTNFITFNLPCNVIDI